MTINQELRRQEKSPATNSTFAIGGVSCSADSLVVAENFVLRINISGKKPTNAKSETVSVNANDSAILADIDEI